MRVRLFLEENVVFEGVSNKISVHVPENGGRITWNPLEIVCESEKVPEGIWNHLQVDYPKKTMRLEYEDALYTLGKACVSAVNWCDMGGPPTTHLTIQFEEATLEEVR